MFFRPSLDVTVLNSLCDINGYFNIVSVDIKNNIFILINIYSPIPDLEQYNYFNELLNNIQNYVKEYENPKLILGGDFNNVLNLSVDRKGEAIQIKNADKEQY